MIQAVKKILRFAGIDREKLTQFYDRIHTNFNRSDIAIFHHFSPPPGGGGHQFLQALWQEINRRGLRVENNTLSPTTRACLCNSFNFDFDSLRSMRHQKVRVVHRVDGPIGVYRGRDEGIDRQIWQINQEIADATIFQSKYAMDRHLELGMAFKSPYVIINACDPAIFNSSSRIPFDRNRKVRLISSSWSENLNKGAPVYKWLEEYLDWQRFEYTFIGRTPIHFDRINMIQPLPLVELAEHLTRSDIFIFASKHESCSNALIEALTCGLPVICIDSGSNAEIVKEAGLLFDSPEEIPHLLETMVDAYESYQEKISVPSLGEVADRYLEVLGWRQVWENERDW